MFENISQGIFNTGAAGYLIVVPVLRLLAVIFMVISTYKILKARQDNHKALWIVAICFSPFMARIAFEIYCRWLNKKEVVRPKGSTPFLIASIVVFVLAAVLGVVSMIALGVGYIKSELSGEPLATFCDMHGNKYDYVDDIPLYDKQGNVYTYTASWPTVGTYTDQNGNSYDGGNCYLSKDGYFYYDKTEQLKPYKNFDGYYTDGKTVYYYLQNRVYWDGEGAMYEVSGNLHLELFDIDK